MAERKYFSKKKGKRVDGIVNQFLNVGRVIESFVQERNIGADAWRQTGVLNLMVNKVTFKRIQDHLQETYKRKFSYGTVVQLCIPRNLHLCNIKALLE